ncbi:hypothetical protein [Aureispira anguillae]|uniref:Uncharacterized protein n=1 Tax=Aureispira anguillae TaxID=2864201 RepID=A0A916DVH0_9BACT|nr:hypothetical protein [Aureispira anguillae]BDS13722.1 hypothetical protein AsAng_0044630 [Aureispira anguillae]
MKTHCLQKGQMIRGKPSPIKIRILLSISYNAIIIIENWVSDKVFSVKELTTQS